MIAQVFKYGLVGGVAALVDFFVFALLATGFGFNYLAVATLSFFLATLVNYLLSIRFVFSSGARFDRTREATLVFGVSAIGYLFNIATLFVGVEYLALHPLLAKIVATGSAFAWNFGARHFFIFRTPEPGEPPADGERLRDPL